MEVENNNTKKRKEKRKQPKGKKCKKHMRKKAIYRV